MITPYGTGPASGEYSVEEENQLQPEDTLIKRGIDDTLDEGYSPPERVYGRGGFGPSESMDQLLAEEEPDPASRINVSLGAVPTSLDLALRSNRLRWSMPRASAVVGAAMAVA
jgi:hypothetical protein